MKSASQGCQLVLFDREKFECLKNSRELFNKTMARHLLGNMVTLFFEHGAVNLDCLYEIGQMNLDDAMRFLSNSPQINSRHLPVAKCFLRCADDSMVEQIFEHTKQLALNYVIDCTHLRATGCADKEGRNKA